MLIFLILFIVYCLAAVGIFGLVFSKPTAKLAGWVVGPLLLSGFTYYLYWLLPEKADIFYLATLLTVGGGLLCLFRWKSIWSSRLDSRIKVNVYAIATGGIVLLTAIRMLLWPIFWHDQEIYYRQAAIYGEVKSTGYLHGTISEEELNPDYTMNQAVRPALPILVSVYWLGGNQAIEAEKVLQGVILYYFLLTLLLTYTLSRKISGNPLAGWFSVFLVSSTFYFINYTIYGFKEVIILSGLLLLFLIIEEFLEHPMVAKAVLIGLVLGLISYVNMSGVLISIIIMGWMFLWIGGGIPTRLLYCLLIGMTAYGFSLGEMTFFSEWVMYGFAKVMQPITGKVISINNSGRFWNPSAQSEFTAFGILNDLDVYVKGKFQGFTQLQYYGLTFWWLIPALTRIKSIWRNPGAKRILLFIGSYFVVLMDPFSLNRHEYSYVLVYSPKYTIMLVPFVAILIGIGIDRYKEIFRRLKIQGAMLVLLAIFWFSAVVSHQIDWAAVIGRLIPLYRSLDYYQVIMEQLFLVMTILSGGLLIAGGVGLITRRGIFGKWFTQMNISWYLFSILPAVILWLIPFNSNFNVQKSLQYALADREVQIEQLYGEPGLYPILRKLYESVDNSSRVVLVNQIGDLVDYQLNIRDNKPLGTKNIYYSWDIKTDWENFMETNKVEWVFGRNSSFTKDEKRLKEYSFLTPVYENGDNLLLQVRN